MKSKAGVRFKDTPVAIRGGNGGSDGNATPSLMKALSIEDSSSFGSFLSEDQENLPENSILSSAGDRDNFIGRTPHSKVVEAAKAKRSFKQLLEPMAPMAHMDISQFGSSPITVPAEGNDCANISLQQADTSSGSSSNSPFTFGLPAREAEEIMSPVPASASGSGRKAAPAVHTPFASSRPSLNKSPEEDDSAAWSGSQKSQSTPTPVQQRSSMSTPSSASSGLSFVLPAYTPPSAGGSPTMETAQVPDSQLSTPQCMLPGQSSYMVYSQQNTSSPLPTPPSFVSPTSSPAVPPNTACTPSVFNQSSAMIATPSSAMIHGLFPTPSMSMVMVSPAVVTPTPAVVSPSPAVVTPSPSANAAALAQSIQQATAPSPHALSAQGSPAFMVISSAMPTPLTTPMDIMHAMPTADLHRAQQRSPVAASNAVGLPSPASLAASPAHPPQQQLVVRTPPAIVQNTAGLNSPVVLAMAGGVALGRGPTIGAASKPPLPKHGAVPVASIQAAIPVHMPAPVAAAVVGDGIAGIASVLSPPAKTWNTPRNTRKLAPGAAMAHANSTVPRPPSAAVQAAAAAVRYTTKPTTTVVHVEEEVEELDTKSVSIQVDPGYFLRMAEQHETGSSMYSSRYSPSTQASRVTMTSRSSRSVGTYKQQVDEMSSSTRQDDSIVEEGSLYTSASSCCLEDLVMAAQAHADRAAAFIGSPRYSGPFNSAACNVGSRDDVSKDYSSFYTQSQSQNSSATSISMGASRVRVNAEEHRAQWDQEEEDELEVSQSMSVSDTSSVTLNKSQFPVAADMTILTDVAVANYTMDMIDGNILHTIEEMEEQQSAVSQSLVSIDSLATGPDTTVQLDITTNGATPPKAYPKLAIKTLKRAEAASPGGLEIPELLLQAAPGEVTTMMLTFANQRSKEIAFSVKTVCARFDNWNGSSRDVDSNCFSASPAQCVVAAKGEVTVHVTFIPPAGTEGNYSGAMQVKQGRKKFTMFLRGEAYSTHSVSPTPAPVSAETASPISAVKSVAKSSSKSSRKSASKSVSMHMSAVKSPSPHKKSVTMNHSIIEQSAEKSVASSEKSHISEKLRMVHDRVAEVSKSILGHNQSTFSPLKTSTLGITSSPCAFTVIKGGHGVRSQFIVKGTFTLSNSYLRPKVLRIKMDNDLFMLSQALVVLHPNQEQHVTLSLAGGQEQVLIRQLSSLAVRARDVTIANVQIKFDGNDIKVPVTITQGGIQELLSNTAQSVTKDYGNSSARHNNSSSAQHSHSHSHSALYNNSTLHSSATTAHYSGARYGHINTNASTLTARHGFADTSSSLLNRSHSSSYQREASALAKQQEAVPAPLTAPSGLYFSSKVVDFGHTSVKQLVRHKIVLNNGTMETLTVYVGDPAAPFQMAHTQLTLRPRTFTKLPVRYLPTTQGVHRAELIVQSEDGSHIAMVTLQGQATA